MAKKDSLIDHRNMGTLYTGWIISLVLTVSMGALAYGLQYTTPFAGDRSFMPIYVLLGVAAVLMILALMFKYIFKREIIAWIFCIGIAAIGLALLLFFGWNWLFSIFIIGALVLLMAMGPYLHFT